MNKILFDCGHGEKDKFELRDIVYINNRRCIMCKTPNKKISLLDVDEAILCNCEFDSLDQLTQHFLKKDGGEDVCCLDGGEWTVYVP